MSVLDQLLTQPLPGAVQSPAYPAGAPGQVQSGPSGFDRFAQVMNIVIPALSAAAAMKQGHLGTFTDTYLGTQAAARREQMQYEQMRQQDMYRQQQAQAQEQDRQIRQQQLQQQEQRRQEQEAIAAEDRKRRILEQHVKAVADNPLTNAIVAMNGTKNFTLKDVPGLGPISLEEALRYAPNGKVGVMDKLPKKEPAPRVPLVTAPGPDGKPIRTEDKPGVEVYERPRVPRQPRESPRTRQDTYEVKENGVVYRVTVDADTGAEIRRTRVRAMTPDEIDDAAEAVDLAPAASSPANTKDPLGIR